MNQRKILMAAAETLFAYSSLFLLLRCVANACTPSACGIISNISYPFRLKDDPNGNNCGHPGGELACENNVTFLYLSSHKYYVKAINYTTTTIRLVDASINTNDACSFPTSSPYSDSLIRLADPYSFIYYLYYTLLYIMSCPHPLKNSSTFANITHCQSQTSNSRFTYFKIGDMKASDVTETCRIDMITMTSWGFKDVKNVSLQEIHTSLLYGFEIVFCSDCGASWTAWDKFVILFDGDLRSEGSCNAPYFPTFYFEAKVATTFIYIFINIKRLLHDIRIIAARTNSKIR